MQFQSEWWYTILRTHACAYILVEKSSSASWRLWLNQLIKEIISYETYLLLYRNMYICVFEYHGEGHFSTSGGDMHRNKSLCGIFASSFPFCFASSHHWRFSYSELFINYVAFNFQDNEKETWYVNTASHRATILMQQTTKSLFVQKYIMLCCKNLSKKETKEPILSSIFSWFHFILLYWLLSWIAWFKFLGQDRTKRVLMAEREDGDERKNGRK